MEWTSKDTEIWNCKHDFDLNKVLWLNKAEQHHSRWQQPKTRAYFSLNYQTSIQVRNHASKNRCFCDLFKWSAKGDDIPFVAVTPHYIAEFLSKTITLVNPQTCLMTAFFSTVFYLQKKILPMRTACSIQSLSLMYHSFKIPYLAPWHFFSKSRSAVSCIV